MAEDLRADRADGIAELRRFARTFTRRIGALEEHYLGRDRPLGVARLLWELGAGGGDVGELRRRLDLDSGYLSRLLRQLEGEQLVRIEPDPDDGRRRRAHLTDLGLLEWMELDHRSDLVASELADGLPPRAVDRLVDLLSEADRLLRAAELRFDVVDPSGREAAASMAAYFAELEHRFEGGFDVAEALAADVPRFRGRRGRFVVARAGHAVVGCGALHRLGPDVVEVKRMWVDPAHRGLAIGRRLLHHLEGLALDLGASRVRLDTNRSLTEAISMYESAGYRDVEAYNTNPDAHRWFEKELVVPDA